MTYPKPLSPKSIEKRFKESGLSQNQIIFLHRLFLAAANLYGSISLQELWDIYRELAGRQSLTKIRKRELLVFSEVVRREDVPYFIFEIDEVYSAEVRNAIERLLVLKEIASFGWYKFSVLYRMEELKIDKSYYIPDNLLDYADGVSESAQERALKDFLGTLKSTAATLTQQYGKQSEPSPHKGKRLSEFSYMTFSDRFDLEYYQKQYPNNPARRENTIKNASVKWNTIYSERLFADIRFRSLTGWVSPQDVLKYLLQDLKEVGVELSEIQLRELMKCLMEYHNSTHLYCNCGWAPSDLMSRMPVSGPLTIRLGPGIQRSIQEGKIDLEELKKGFESQGVNVILPEELR